MRTRLVSNGGNVSHPSRRNPFWELCATTSVPSERVARTAVDARIRATAAAYDLDPGSEEVVIVVAGHCSLRGCLRAACAGWAALKRGRSFRAGRGPRAAPCLASAGRLDGLG
jgi:hypothetical protein